MQRKFPSAAIALLTDIPWEAGLAKILNDSLNMEVFPVGKEATEKFTSSPGINTWSLFMKPEEAR